ncbi:GTPase Obg [Vulcanimicrobium alpinum]|uniref:GTPase Obg n=1 Tax=Vulcanimicrobium alpinum TaxID=3016050 RepID=A0AAN1Y059_UNVUL|nr:GTPase ObgE [Vulcanimicrobium alpinum]BDE08214.1 GTPase Obg [Vulcanimicrobium alpinum]
MQFIDEATIGVAAGKGGDGIVAWRREKYVPKGGPAGGDGGRGGDVVLLADPELGTLVDFRFKKQFAADSGKAGSTSNKSGKAGDDLIVRVPVGTLVTRTEIDGEGNRGHSRLFADMSTPNERVRVAKGGRGGLGNQHFATAARQAPRFAYNGEPGERCELKLELKLLADAGILGLPNAGKSTLLSVVSAARPKIADYPFTTLDPQLGVVRVAEFESFVMVDVPGLIEGAHEGAGLGDRFLRHVERTRVLVHLIAGDKSVDEVLADKATIENELRAWNAALLDRPTIVVITKLDLPDARATYEALRETIPGVRGISAATGEGVQELIYATWETIRATPLPAVAQPEPAQIQLSADEPFEIRKEEGIFVVSGERVERLANMTDFDSDEALARFEQILAKMGVDRKLRELGVQEGDTVRIAGVEFDYS